MNATDEGFETAETTDVTPGEAQYEAKPAAPEETTEGEQAWKKILIPKRSELKELHIYYHGSACDDVYCLLMVVWAILLAGYFIFVHPYLTFTQTTPLAPFNGLTFASVPYYSGAIAPVRSEIYISFDYWVWMSDYIIGLIPFMAVGIFFLVFRCQITSVGPVYIVAVVATLIQISKAIYWSVEITPALCAKFPYCTTHNLGLPATTPNVQFVVAVIFAWIQTLGCLFLFMLPTVVKEGWRKTLRTIYSIQSRLPAAQKVHTPINDVAFSFTDARALRRRAPPAFTSTGADYGRPPPVRDFFVSEKK